CCIDIPVIPGIMMGSFGAREAGAQVSVKMPGLLPPDGKPAVGTLGGVAALTAAAVTAAVPAARTRAAAAAIESAMVAQGRGCREAMRRV
ncbi:hypothetical protein SB767_31240, partial [Bacillus sp. SIMBA_069]